jgi:oligopeptide transport system substrate-binding protein
MAEMPIIPIYTYTYKHLLHTSVKGVHDNILDYHPYKYVYLESTDQ